MSVDSHALPRSMVAALALLLDVLGVAMAVVVTVTTVAGPWSILVGGHLLRVRSTGNLIAGCLLLALLRGLVPAPPILGRRAWSLAHVRRGAAARLEALSRRLDVVDARTALRVVGILVLVASAIRVGNVFAHFGFITGDDVEIHEMTLGVALGKGWPVWDLRNAFYPMTFVFPVQRALVALGVTDVFSLVAAGRLVVTAIAGLNIWILYRVALSTYGDRGTALIAAALLAANHLHMTYGSAELPRIVATAFLMPAFGALRTPTPLRCALAGVLLGLGASLRFGEIVFAVPALVSVLQGSPADAGAAPWRVRLTQAAVVLAALAATILVVIGVSDALYWGRPFHSLLAIVDYTLVQRLSSRGYEPPWYYLAHVTDWSNVLLVVLAGLAWRRTRRSVLLWAALPLALLSVLPHKEARYAIATIPFWALAAAPTLRSWLARGEVRAPGIVHARLGALGIALLVAAALAFDAGKFRFVRSEAAVRLGRTMERPASGIAAEQLWRFGGHLYLDGATPLVDLDPQQPDTLIRDACRAEMRWAAIRLGPHLKPAASVLRRCGFVAGPTALEAGYQLFRRHP